LVQFKIPKTKISPDFIFDALQEDEDFNIKPTAKIVWLGGKPFVEHFTKSKKEIPGNDDFDFHDKKKVSIFKLIKEGEWLVEMLLKFLFLTLKSTLFKK
jgi:hypothetical protein